MKKKAASSTKSLQQRVISKISRLATGDTESSVDEDASQTNDMFTAKRDNQSDNEEKIYFQR